MVQQELKEALQMGETLERTGNNVWIGALTAEGAAYGPDWKASAGVEGCLLGCHVSQWWSEVLVTPSPLTGGVKCLGWTASAAGLLMVE